MLIDRCEEETLMRVFVAGGTGAIGRRLVPALVARGHEVVATTRRSDKVPILEAQGAGAVVVDALDATAVGAAVAEAEPDVIVHQATALAGAPNLRRFDRWFATTNDLRTRGTDHLLAAARAAGVGHFVAQSYTGWNNARQGGQVKDEDDQLDPHPLAAQSESAAALRYLERAVTQAPLQAVVLRYGNFYGPGESESLVELIRKRRLPLIGDGAGVWSWVHLDDAAAATVAALERGQPGVYNVVDDDPAPVAEWLPYLAELVGAKPPLRVPAWLGRLAAGAVPVRWMTEARGASNAKARRALDWRPAWGTWRDGFRDGLGSLSAAAGTRPSGPEAV
jgi:nucleoside-diphosphate-sugar epimerase